MKKWCLLLGALGAVALLLVVAFSGGNVWSGEATVAGTRGGGAVAAEQPRRRRLGRRLFVPIPIPDSTSSALKLYWQQGYMWQEDPRERRWCMVCRGGCSAGNAIRLTECDSGTSPTQFQINRAVVGSYAMIQPAGTNVCFQANPQEDEIYLATCDSLNQDQWFNGNFRSSRFEIHPVFELDQCLTQEHHPKSFEEVLIRYCDVARHDETSYWERY